MLDKESGRQQFRVDLIKMLKFFSGNLPLSEVFSVISLNDIFIPLLFNLDYTLESLVEI